MTQADCETTERGTVRKLKDVVALFALSGASTFCPPERRTAQDGAIRSVMAERFPDMGIAAAVERERALYAMAGQANEEMPVGSAQEAAAPAIAAVLSDFILTAPARTLNDAKARVRYLVDFLDGGTPERDVLAGLGERIIADFEHVAMPRRGSVFAEWQLSNPFNREA